LARAPRRTTRKKGSGYENGLSRASPRPHTKALGTRLQICCTLIYACTLACEQALFELFLKFEREPAGRAINKNASVRCLERRRVPLVEIE
jgi:hypothetical protein